MKEKFKSIFTNWKILFLIICLLLSVIAIHPSPDNEGAAIRTITQNSTAFRAGLTTPKPNISPVSREVITAINGKPIKGELDFYAAMDEIYQLPPGTSIIILTDKNPLGYSMVTEGMYETITLPELEKKIINATEEVVEGNLTLNKTVEKTVTVNKTKEVFKGMNDIGIKVYDAPKTNIRKGLDLEGGTRVLLQPETQLSDEDFKFLISNMEQRMNVYGLTDLSIRKATDLEGKSFIVVEIAGVNEEEVKDLLSKQGKFEAKVGNTTVFIGGRDITYVAAGADAGIDPYRGCQQANGGWLCRFRFGISLTPEAAQRQADTTKNLTVLKVDEQGQPVAKDNQFLDKKIDFFLDDQLTDSLNIGADLQGRAVTEIQISGSGAGATQQAAIEDALANMKKLQTILKTGSLPVKLTIIKTDTISPLLGDEFINNAFLVGFFALICVTLVIYVAYRKLIITIPIILTLISELVMIMGFAAIYKWNLDLAGIAGIIIAIGTGVDHLVILTDESLKEKSQLLLTWTERLKKAFIIIVVAFSTIIAAMIPLFWVGVGMLKGFAFATIFSLVFGVLIARPAYGEMIEILLKD